MPPKNELSDKKLIDYDTPDIAGMFDYTTEGSSIRTPQFSNRGVTLRELQEGTVIDTDAEIQKEDETEDRWWTREELLKHIDNNDLGLDLEEEIGLFEDKIERMEVIIPDRVWKRTLRGGTGLPVTEKDSVSFHYNAFLETADEPFDSSVLRGIPHLNRLDQGDIIPGLFHGLVGMKVNEKAEILIHHEYGFGELGCPPRIPAKSMLLYIVEVKKIYIEGTLQDMEIMTPEELAQQPFEKILKSCHEMRVSGNSYFRDGQFKEAAFRYRKAINIMERYSYKNEQQEAEGNALMGLLYPNIASAYIKLKKSPAAMASCRKCLYFDPKNVKALYNLGRAKYQSGEYTEAAKYLTEALKLKPGDKNLIENLRKVDEEIAQEKRNTDDFYRGIGKKYFNS